jgi:hypothetical protein
MFPSSRVPSPIRTRETRPEWPPRDNFGDRDRLRMDLPVGGAPIPRRDIDSRDRDFDRRPRDDWPRP